MTARDWLARSQSGPASLSVVGAPLSSRSRSPSEGWRTPDALRAALTRFPTWDALHGVDLDALDAVDLGNCRSDRDGEADISHADLRRMVADAASSSDSLAILGGDNSITATALSTLRSQPGGDHWGLITLDAHHDTRPLTDGPSNGTPVRELIEGGLPGERIVQIGIAPFGNEKDYAQWTAEQGVTIITLEELRVHGAVKAGTKAVDALRSKGVRRIYLDVDCDVVDRAYAPACPGSLPGGIGPADLMELIALIGEAPECTAADFVEVDAGADSSQVTIRLMALAFLTYASSRLRAASHV